jgi:hypothetical protein
MMQLLNLSEHQSAYGYDRSESKSKTKRSSGRMGQDPYRQGAHAVN